MSGNRRRLPRWIETLGLIVLVVVVAIAAAVATAALIDLIA